LITIDEIPFKMNSKKNLLLVIGFVLLFSVEAMSQQKFGNPSSRVRSRHIKGFNRIEHYELLTVYAGIGLSTYFGDLCEGLECMKPRLNFGVGALYRLPYWDERIHIKTEVNWFRLYGKDYYPIRNLTFRSNNLEFYTSAMISLFPYEKHFRRRRLFDPYAFVGIGLVYYNPQAYIDGKWVNLRPLQTEGVSYSSVAPIVPYGVGIRVNLDVNWNLLVEGGYRWTSTDYLDDVSGPNYKDPNSFNSQLAAKASYRSDTQGLVTRGNPKSGDGYFLFNARLTYTFSNSNVAKFRGKQHILRK
jgi:Outer membrane protein beta-barrel domain